MKDENIQLYLASASPRRRELLAQIGLRFRVLPQEVDEGRHADEAPEAYVRRLAREKAAAGRRALPAESRIPVLGADTIVVCGERILGKPGDREEGLAMLALLSGRRHRVLTAVALENAHQTAEELSASTVEFRALEAGEIRAYWDTGEPRDKAGAYAVQGLAALFIRSLEGSYSGVMGLPLFETAALLRRFGLDPVTLLRECKP